MPSNVEILTRALKILADRGVDVELIPGWQTRTGSRSRTLTPEAVVVHHTGDPSTPLSLIRDGRVNLPGPLANFLVGQSGRIYLVAAGYSNNAGYGGRDNFAMAKAGKLQGQAKPPTSDGTWSANGYGWAIEGDGRAEWPAVVRANVVKVAAALHLAHGWTGARVIGHKELTRRKPVDPAEDMGQVRAEVLAQIEAWTEPEVPVEKRQLVVVSANIQAKRWGGGKYILDGKFVAEQFDPDVILGQEVQDKGARDSITKATNTIVWPFRYLSLFLRRELKEGPKLTLPFPGTIHGAVASELVGGVVFCSVHTRSSDAIPGGAEADDREKREDIASLVAWLRPHPRVVVGGDFNTAAHRVLMEAAGYHLATPWTGTTDGGKKLDGIYVRGVEFEGGRVVPTPHSDHHVLAVTITVPATNTL